MGGGEVLESGTHNNLLLANGPYAVLVNGQSLAAAEEESPDDDESELNANGMTSAELQAYARKEKPELERTTTGKSSLTSELIKSKMPGSSIEGRDVLSYRTIALRFWRSVKIQRRQRSRGSFFAWSSLC